MNPQDPTQRMREILEALQQPSKKPYPGEKLKRTNIALAELSKLMDEAKLETAETIRQDIEHTTECDCCANGGGEHDFYAHLRIIDRYIAAPQQPKPIRQ
jgi:hypothetical protein